MLLQGTHSKQVADSNSEADGEAGRASEVCALGIAGGKHGEDQLKCDQEFHEKAVSCREAGVHLTNRGYFKLTVTNLFA